MKVNVHDILSYAGDVITGRKRGKDGEYGWTKGEWHDTHRVCLGAALRVAEQDLVEGIRYAGRYERDLDYRPAISAEQTLANAITKLHPELCSADSTTYLDRFSNPRDIIIAFNDREATDEDDIGEVLELADKMVWEAELEAEMAKQRDNGTMPPVAPFIDFVTGQPSNTH